MKRLSSYIKKVASIDVPLEQEDFKVLNVQKIHSIKLDDHLNVEKNPNCQTKTENKFVQRRRSSNPESPSPKKDINLFLEAKFKYMKSKSVKHS